MRIFAVLCGVFLGAILVVSGYAMAFLHDDIGYPMPLFLALAALAGLPLAYLLKATRKLPRGLSRILFILMIVGLIVLWVPVTSRTMLWDDHAPPLAIFSVIWIIAALPLLRAGIRHRP